MTATAVTPALAPAHARRDACPRSHRGPGRAGARVGSRALVLCVLLTSCGTLPTDSHAYNPLGWPSKAFQSTGFVAADSGWPFVREFGRLLGAVGELLDAPALLVEGVATASPDTLGAGLRHTVFGSGSTLTAAYNLPCFVMPGRNIDLGRDAEVVNEALAFLETVDPAEFRLGDFDDRESVFPKGTRCRRSGENLIYTIPGRGEVLQSAESSIAFDWLNTLASTSFGAQERSWGFVVRTKAAWDERSRYRRAVTILHELCHQEQQMRQVFVGWNFAYWPAYMAPFPFTGHEGHWAEGGSALGANAVNRGLTRWFVRNWRREKSEQALRQDSQRDS